MLSGIIDMPKERLLRNDNEELRTQLKIIDARLENAREVMEHLAERDNNFYRVMMQADPITSAERFQALNGTQAMGLILNGRQSTRGQPAGPCQLT